MQWRYHAHPLFLSRAVRRRGQQRLRPEGVRIPAARRRGVPARAHLRRLVGAARAVALHRRRQRHHHRSPHRQVPADDRRETNKRGARYRPPDHPHARRPLLGDVLLALEGQAVLAAVPRTLMRTHPSLTPEGLDKAREYNAQRYYFLGIGRYAPDAAYRRGLKDLQVLADLLPASGGYLHGEKPTSIDAGIYGFIANIHFYDIDTPLKQF